MAELNDDVQGFLKWLPSYLQARGERRGTLVTLDDLESPQLRGLGFLSGAVAAYKRHLNPPPPPRSLEEALTADDLAFYNRQTDEVKACLLDSIHRLDPRNGKVDSLALKSMIEFIAGPQLKP